MPRRNGFYMDFLPDAMRYAELQVTSNFSFLRGGSHPEELVEQAAAYGYEAIAITDRNSLAGIVRAHIAAKKLPVKFIPACRLDLLDGPGLLAYPTDITAYSRLSALLTVGNLRAEKGECHLYKADVFAYKEGIKFIIVPPEALNARFDYEDDFKAHVKEYRSVFGDALYIAATRSYSGDDAKTPVPAFAIRRAHGGCRRTCALSRRLFAVNCRTY